MFKQFSEVICQKAKEYVAEQGRNNALNIKDFDDTLEDLQNNLKLLSAKAVDVETEIKNAEDSGRKKRKREVEVWLEQVESIRVKVEELGREAESKGFIMRFLDGGKAAQLKLVQQRLHIGEAVLDARGNQGETLLTNEMVGEAFHQNFETILEVLENGQVSRIGVYGMGGVGKTTLAKHIYNRLVQEYEGRVVWVTVSHEFTTKSLQEKIAHFMGVKLEDEDEEAFRASRLRKILSDRKISVLILDDVWRNVDMREMGCDLEGCRLIITTRSVVVCHQIGCQKEIPVGKLLEGEAWKLFNRRLGNEKLDPEVEGFAKDMVKLCGGLPLAIITVARTMRGKRGSHRWRNDFLELKERVKGHDGRGEDVVFEVLKFSFDRLKEKNDKNNEFNMFRHCFLYCSLYPEDYQIKRDDLVRKFISGGLLYERRSRRARFDQGHSILDELVEVCLLESCVDSYGRKCVKMHDLVRGMALMICKGKYMVRAGEWSLVELPNEEEEWTQDLEKVSLMQCSIERIGEGFSPDCPKLSTKLSKRLEKVPYLGNMKALRELNLFGTGIKEAPQGLEELLNLRFLSIYAPGLMMLPRGVLLKLVHLEHLSIPLRAQVSTEEIKKLKQLEEFGGGVTSVGDFNWFITTRGVHGNCCYKIGVGTMNASGIAFENRGDLGGKTNELVLHKCDLRDEKVLGKDVVFLTVTKCEGLSKCFEDDLSERFGNPTSLERVHIGECGGIEWILRSDVQASQLSSSLEHIHLSGLDDLKGVVVMERGEIGPFASAAQPAVFPSLKQLHIFCCKKMKEQLQINYCGEIEEIFEQDEGTAADSILTTFTLTLTLPKLKDLILHGLSKLRNVGLPVSGFPNLEVINITDCGEMEEIFKEDEGSGAGSSLPKLRELSLGRLPRLRNVGLSVSDVPNLEYIYIEACEGIEEIFEEDEGRAAGSIFTTFTLPKLTWLSLEELPNLKSVSNGTIISDSIEQVSIKKCPRLMNKLPLHFDFDDQTPPPSLSRMLVEREWWESLEWDTHINPNLPLLLQDFVEFFEEEW